MIQLDINEKRNIAKTLLYVFSNEKYFLENELNNIEEVELSESAKAYTVQINRIAEKINYLEQNLDNLV
jgi:hypothetical protein